MEHYYRSVRSPPSQADDFRYVQPVRRCRLEASVLPNGGFRFWSAGSWRSDGADSRGLATPVTISLLAAFNSLQIKNKIAELPLC